MRTAVAAASGRLQERPQRLAVAARRRHVQREGLLAARAAGGREGLIISDAPRQGRRRRVRARGKGGRVERAAGATALQQRPRRLGVAARRRDVRRLQALAARGIEGGGAPRISLDARLQRGQGRAAARERRARRWRRRARSPAHRVLGAVISGCSTVCIPCSEAPPVNRRCRTF
ncbi:MAG: hypothetical protein J3K34DRAFT_173110 [Monoraphidium minutum]|nr:MAG: hypothetical protein J3K34DRAFT_173110 [Monoraphidium minutum]